MWSHAWPGPNPTSVGTATSCLDLGMPPCFSGIGVGGTTSLATTPIAVSVSNNGSFWQHVTQRVLLFSSLNFYGICKELKTWKLTWQSKCKHERLLWLGPVGGPGLLVLKVQSLPSLKFSELFICASVEWLNTFLHISGLAWDGLSGTSVRRCRVRRDGRMSFKSHTSSSLCAFYLECSKTGDGCWWTGTKVPFIVQKLQKCLHWILWSLFSASIAGVESVLQSDAYLLVWGKKSVKNEGL